MLSAIDLDHELCFDAGEVGDIGRNGMLAPEVPSANLSSTQQAPELAFCIGGNAAHAAGLGERGFLGAWHVASAYAPSLTLPRFAGEGIWGHCKCAFMVEKGVERSHP